MPGVVIREKKPVDLPALMHELKDAGYRKGSWECIPGSDLLRVKAWRTKDQKAKPKVSISV